MNANEIKLMGFLQYLFTGIGFLYFETGLEMSALCTILLITVLTFQYLRLKEEKVIEQVKTLLRSKNPNYEEEMSMEEAFSETGVLEFMFLSMFYTNHMKHIFYVQLLIVVCLIFV